MDKSENVLSPRYILLGLIGFTVVFVCVDDHLVSFVTSPWRLFLVPYVKFRAIKSNGVAVTIVTTIVFGDTPDTYREYVNYCN